MAVEVVRNCCGCGKPLPIPKNWSRMSLWKRTKQVQCQGCKGFKHGLSRTRLYRIWQGMMVRCGHRRCWNPSAIEYYISRGIIVCEAWRYFPTFAKWAQKNEYGDGLTIDRVDSDRNYEPDNCRWVPMRENLRARKERKLTR